MRTELVTTLKRKATEIIADLEQDHEPVLITQHGRPAAYLIDVDSFEALNHRIAVLEGIARAEQAIDQGRVISHEEAKNKMGRWLDLSEVLCFGSVFVWLFPSLNWRKGKIWSQTGLQTGRLRLSSFWGLSSTFW